MENTFIQKSTVKRILIALIFVLLFNFIVPYYSNVSYATYAGTQPVDQVDEYDYDESTKANKESAGGKLLAPIKALLLFIGDSILEILQNSFVSQMPVVISVQSKDYGTLNGWVTLGIVLGAVLIIGSFAVAGIGVVTAVAAVQGVSIGLSGGVIGTIAAIGGGTVASGAQALMGGVATGVGASILFHKIERNNAGDWKGQFELPFIMYTPGRIFSNSIPLFDINFINPQVANLETNKLSVNSLEKSNYIENLNVKWIGTEGSLGKNKDEIIAEYKETYGYEDRNLLSSATNERLYNELTEKLVNWAGINENVIENIYWTNDSKIYGIRVREITMTQQITNGSGMVMGTEVNTYNGFDFIEADMIGEAISSDDELIMKKYESSANILQTTVASWYKTLRTLAIVALLTILVYVGIRIVLSSTAKDKAKYKQMIMDWLVALCILFVMHYLMAFILYISEQLTQICEESDIENVAVEVPADLQYTDEGGQLHTLYEENLSDDPDSETQFDATASTENTVWWGTNFVGLTRLIAGLPSGSVAYRTFGYTIIYLVLVIYTCVFTFMYLKRVLWMAFLTMIAPLVAITYPIDKINDGKAQAFSLWLREYIFNALMQPMHYLIYTVIIGSAMALIVDHPAYALVALGFMMPAEKFIRKMFGFEKAATPAALGGAAAAGLMMSSIQRLTGHPPHGDKEEEDETAKPKETKAKLNKTSNPFEFLNDGSKEIGPEQVKSGEDQKQRVSPRIRRMVTKAGENTIGRNRRKIYSNNQSPFRRNLSDNFISDSEQPGEGRRIPIQRRNRIIRGARKYGYDGQKRGLKYTTSGDENNKKAIRFRINKETKPIIEKQVDIDH